MIDSVAMNKFCAIFFALILIIPVNCFLRMNQGPNQQTQLEYIDIHITEGGRTKRSTDDTFHPETYDLDVPLSRSHINLHLTRNDNIRTSVQTLSLKGNSMTYVYLEDKIESIFYQDVVHGAVFVYQYDRFEETRMFGMFNIGSEEYIVQTPENITYTTLKSGLNQFEIRKEKIHEIDFNDFLEKVDTTTQATDNNDTFTETKHRNKRATGLHQLELLIVVDYTVYKYWYDQSNQTSTSQKETEALTSVRQYYAFVITGMDGMFKNIQTSSYTIDIVFAGIVIAQTPSDASWTETIKVTSVTPNQVDASIALGNFQTWNNNPPFSLPGHDHAMLFTRYHLRLGSGGIAGLAYVSQVCTSVSQSIVAYGFNFLMISVASHELGHCLSSQHDGYGNGCSGSDSYIMASGIGPQTKPATATHPWIFSSCSTAYFTNYINSLDSAGNNCMKTLSPGFDPTGLTPYDQQLAGQLFSADEQCAQIGGTGSSLCYSLYYGDFSTICTVLWCSNPAGGNCNGAIGGDGTHCGDKKWCISGVCTSDSNAPPADDETCLYGDVKGKIFTNGWTCEDMVREAPGYCSSVRTSCCASCALFPTTTLEPTTDADQQCVRLRGTGSHLCRSPYGGDFSTICTRLWCADTAGNGNCHGHGGGVNGTLCGNKKWCISGVCTSDSNAPAGVETCLYGDKRGVIFSNGWTCEDMVRNAPGYCSSTTACCASCAPPTTTSTTTPATTTIDYNTTATTPSFVTITYPTTTTLATTTTVKTTTDADQQCVQNRGTGSYLCRSPYSGDFSTICTRLWCADTAGNGNCHGHSGGVNKTLCGNKKWCISGVCTSDSNAPAGVETCLYGDKRGVIFSNGWTCEDMVRNAPSYCSSTTACCASCVPPTTPSTTTPTMTTTTPTTTTTTLSTTTKTPAKTTTTPASITTTPTMTTNIPTTTTLATTTKTNTPTTSTIQSTTKETSTTVQLTKTNETTSTVQPTADKPTTTVQSTLTERTTTTVQPTTIKKTTTTVQPPTSDETPTTVQSTIFEETTTTVQPTTTKETTTTVQSHTSTETTIPGQPPTSEEATTIVKPQSSEKTTTAVQTPTSKGTTTTVQPTTTKETTTTVQPLTSKETTTTVQPSTSKGTTTTVQPSTTTETTTTVQPPTSEETITTVQPPTSEETTTTGQPPTSEETITTVQPPTSEETTTTVQAPTSIETTSTVQPTSNAETTSTSQPSTSEVSATIRPTTIEETSTTIHLTKTDETTTIVQQITTDKNVTTVQPPTTTAQTSTTERITITFQPTTKEQTTTTVNPISTEHTAISGQRASTEQTIATVLPTTKERRTTVQLSITDKTTKVQHTTTEQTTTTVQPATMTTKPTTTSKTTSQPSQPSVTIEYKYTCRLRLMITVTISLTDTTTEEYQSLFNEVLIALTNYYRQSRSCKQSFRRIVLILIRAGSLIPEYEVYLDEPSPGDVIAAGYDLTTGNGNLTIGNETVEAETSSVTTNNQTSTVTSADNLCDAFNQISSCPDNYGCRINSSTNAPYCALKMIEMDNYSLILQLAVGIPMAFLLFVLIVLLYIVCKSHRQQQTKTKYIEEDLDKPVPKEKSLFAGNMAKRYHGSKSFLPFGGYWDNGSFDYHEDIDRTSYLGIKSNFSDYNRSSTDDYFTQGQRNSYTTNCQVYNGRLSYGEDLLN